MRDEAVSMSQKFRLFLVNYMIITDSLTFLKYLCVNVSFTQLVSSPYSPFVFGHRGLFVLGGYTYIIRFY